MRTSNEIAQETPDATQSHRQHAKRGARYEVAHRAHVSWEEIGPYGVVYQITFGNLEAVLKSTDILARGMRMLNTAVIGSTCMTMDDTIADSRSAMSCRSVKTFVVREVDLAMVTVNRSLGRMTVLGRMASQLIEDALFPLERRFFIVFDLLNRKAA